MPSFSAGGSSIRKRSSARSDASNGAELKRRCRTSAGAEPLPADSII